MSRSLSALVAVAVMAGAGSAVAATAGEEALKDRTIGYIITDEYWGVYQTPGGKIECPEGLNEWGPREQFKSLYPNGGTVKDTQLERESAIWHPTLGKDQFPYKLAGGPTAYGVNLDGKVGPNDFASPDGEKGIDNQLYRAIGCNEEFRGPTGILHEIVNQYTRRYDFNRVMIELTNVDSLVDDPDVDVTILRGRDRLLTDATGDQIIPGGTQRVDARWGKRYLKHLKGKIVGGVLVTEPADIRLPHAIYLEKPGEDAWRGARLHFKLTATRAEGVLAGYSDIDRWYYQLNTNWATVYQSYGQLSSPSLYKKLHELADGYPDPKTGAMTAISSAMVMKFTQVFIQHPPKEVAEDDRATLPSPRAAGER